MRIHKASLKLAGLYLAIIMFISLFFSVTVYQLSVREVYAGYRKQQDLLERSPDLLLPQDLRDELFNERAEQYEDTRAAILGRLVLVNIAIFLAGGFLSYFMARRTIRPIEEAHENMSRFTADASHELRTPLAVLQSEIEVALMNPKLNLKSAKIQLESNLEELSKLINLSEGLLQLSQLENGELDKKPADLRKIIKAAINTHKASAEAKNIKLNVLSNTKQKVSVDTPSIQQVIGILVDNAIKYSPSGATVKIEPKITDKQVLIKVINNGIGIDPIDKSRIFDRFYRADSARTKKGAGGYGLGLSIAKSIVQLHGGSIKVSSAPDQETIFTISLPKT